MMGIERQKKEIWRIDFWQLTALNASLTLGAIIPLSSAGRELGRHIWLAGLVYLGGGLLLCLILAGLTAKYPGKSLAEINKAVWGERAGRAVNLVFLLQAFVMFVFVLYSMTNFWGAFGMERSSYLVYAVLMIALSFFAAGLGLEAIGRIAMIAVPLLLAIFLLDVLLVMPQLDLQRILPLGGLDPDQLAKVSGRLFSLAYSLWPLSLMLAPYLKEQSKTKASIIAAWGFGGAYIMLSGLRTVFLLGDGLTLYHYPVVQALRMVEWGPVYSRFELLGLMIIMAITMIALMLDNFVICLLAQEIMPVKERRSLLLPLALLELLEVWLAGKYMDQLGDSLVATLFPAMTLAIVLLLLFSALKRVKK